MKKKKLSERIPKRSIELIACLGWVSSNPTLNHVRATVLYFPLKKGYVHPKIDPHTAHKREIRKEISFFFSHFYVQHFYWTFFSLRHRFPLFFSWIWDLNGAPCNDVLLYNDFFAALYMLDFFFHDDFLLLRLVNYRRPIYSNPYTG